MYRILCGLGRPIGGLRPRKIYDLVGRRAYPEPNFQWVRNRWGSELLLSSFYHIDRNILIFGTYDENLHLMIETLLKPGMVCMDVGANLGEMTLHMAARVGPGGRVYAFEPVSSVRERLQAHVERNGVGATVKILPLALSNQTGRTRIHFATATADNQGLASIVNADETRLPLAEEVATTTLDEFVAREEIARLDLMKIDIQGAEPLLFAGATTTLRTLSPDLLIEISPRDLQHSRSSGKDLIHLIESHGYETYLVVKGRIGSRIHSATLVPSFHATNVFCTKRPAATAN